MGYALRSVGLTLAFYCPTHINDIYAVQQDTQSVLRSEFHAALMLARHVSDLTVPSSGAFLTSYIRRLICGTTVRTARHVQPLLRNGWTCRVVRVLPHTKSANTACTKRS